MALDKDYFYVGTPASDTIGDRYVPRYLFGLQGEDAFFINNLYPMTLVSFATFAAGGSDSDTYRWDGTGVLYIVETGGDADTYIDQSSTSGIKWAAEVGDHLVLWDDYNNAIIYTNYKDSNARIENFYINTDDGVRIHYTHDQFITMVQQQHGWRGTLSYEAMGLGPQVQDMLVTYLAEMIQLSHEYESGTQSRSADKDDVSVLGRLYQAAFDRTPDVGGLNYWVDQWEENMEPLEVASRFYDSAEFKARYGSPSDEGFIDLLYENVLDRDPDAGGLNYWLGELAGGMDRSEVLARFSESTENIANTEVTFNALHDTGDGYWMF